MSLNERDSLLSSKLKGRMWFRSLIGRVLSDYQARENRRINFEPLESRQLMAADFFESTSNAADNLSLAGETNSYAYYSQFSSNLAEGEGEQGEGEDAPNLVEFAKALTQAGFAFLVRIGARFARSRKSCFKMERSFCHSWK
jgi:hypothetical protein